MSDKPNTANDLFFPTDTVFDEQELRRQAAEAFIYNTSEDVLVCMEAAGLSQAALARRIGMNPSLLSRVLSGEQNMTLKTLSDLCYALEMSPRLTLNGPGVCSEIEAGQASSAGMLDLNDGEFDTWQSSAMSAVSPDRTSTGNIITVNFPVNASAPIAA